MLEDDFCDVMAKARHGLGLSLGELAVLTGLPEARLRVLESGALPDANEVIALALALNLRAGPLQDLAQSSWQPQPPAGRIGNWETLSLELHDQSGFASNTHLIWLPESKVGVIVDPGFEGQRTLNEVKIRDLRIRYLAITHGHHDHVGEAGTLADHLGVPVLIGRADWCLLPENERSPRFCTMTGGERFSLDQGVLEVLGAPGHTRGGCFFLADGLACVGDTLFAGSIGRTFGGPANYPTHLGTVRKILALPPETCLLPGHGPNTTVGQEREHNPFA